MPDEIHDEEAESLRLPRNWHALVRSAVLNVIGIVRIAMLTGRETLIKNGDAPDARIHQLESPALLPRSGNGHAVHRARCRRSVWTVILGTRSSSKSTASTAVVICR